MLCSFSYRRGLLVVQAEFVHIPPQQTWTAWTIDLLVKKPVVWIFNKVKDSVIKTKEIAEDTVYVHVAACLVGGISESRLLDVVF
jgi:hypothetical protein